VENGKELKKRGKGTEEQGSKEQRHKGTKGKKREVEGGRQWSGKNRSQNSES